MSNNVKKGHITIRVPVEEYTGIFIEIPSIGFGMMLQDFMDEEEIPTGDLFEELRYLVQNHSILTYNTQATMSAMFIVYARLLRKKGYFENVEPYDEITGTNMDEVLFDGSIEELFDSYPIETDETSDDDYWERW